MKKFFLNWYKVFLIFLILILAGVSAAAFLLWQKIQEFEPDVYYYVPAERSFVYGQEELAKFGIEEYVREKITTEKAKLIEKKRSFIYINLNEMKLTLYEEGEIFEFFSIQSKGKEGTWWETAPGAYFVGEKVLNHFSSISKVWMPYGIQFYGNFFIHGWPYYANGRPLAPGSSGGCIRLKTEDAARVFEFAERGMPVLVFEEKIVPPLPALRMIDPETPLPDIKSQVFLVTDLETGEILINKEMDSEIYAGPITGGMLALAASEVINLEKRIVARDWMIEGIKEGIIVPGKSYRAYDLLYPLLSRTATKGKFGESSKESALVLSRFLTPEYFLTLINIKAKAIGMNNTNFTDITGISKGSLTTVYDIARMMRYIKDFRGFIFEISVSDKNFPGEEENLVGILAGPAENGEETVAAVWKMKTLSSDESRNIFIGIANSTDAKEDLKNILSWLDKGFGLK